VAANQILMMINLTLKNRFPLMLVALFELSATNLYAADLMDTWHAAQAKDPTFSAARAGAEAGKKKNNQAKALSQPQITAMVGAGGANTYNKISDAQFSAPGFGTSGGGSFKSQTDFGADFRWNINAEKSLYNAEHSSMAQQLNKQAQLADLKFSAEEQQLILRVSKAYFDVLLAEDTLTSVKKQRTAVAKALEVAKGRFAEGDVAIIDTNEAQARDDALVSQELEADINYQLAVAALVDLTGATEPILLRPEEQVNLQSLDPGQLNDWLTLAQINSPYLHMQQLQQGIAHDEIDKHRSSNSPVVNLVAQVGGEELRGFAGGNQSDLSNHSLSVGVQLTIPLFTGGMREAKYAEAVALEEQAKDETEAERIRAGQQARAAWLGVTVGKSKIKATEQALHSSQVKLDATKLGKEAGDRTTLDILNAEHDYFMTKTALYRERYQMLLSYLNLAAVAGLLDEKRLAEVNAFLEHK
jgi:outer membrane protein